MKCWISTLRLIHHQTLPRQIQTAPEEEQKPKESSSGISYLRSFYSSSYYPDSKSAGSYFRADVTAHKAKIKISPPSLPASSLHLLFTPLPSSGSPSISSPPPFLILSILHHPSLLSSPPSTPTAGPQIDSHGSRLTEDDYTLYEHTHICTHTRTHTYTHTHTLDQ